MVTINVTSSTDIYQPGSIVTYSCPANHLLVGLDKNQCLGNEFWSVVVNETSIKCLQSKLSNFDVFLVH